MAVVYSGLLQEYKFQSSRIDELFERIEATFSGSSVIYLSSTKDYSKIIVEVSGNDGANTIMSFDSQSVSITAINQGYRNISQGDIGEIGAINYKARDGMKIPAVLTWPTGITKENKKSLPLLVFPHGGPESYDRLRFDWWAQYFANRGHLVFQPNFRGSAGFGADHVLAGRGKWGLEMQDDVSDGVLALVKIGYADAERVCIMGASYGVYSALAGGAFSPELYRCVISVAGVTDLPKMLKDTKINMESGTGLTRIGRML